jgi:hypothetical protein
MEVQHSVRCRMLRAGQLMVSRHASRPCSSHSPCNAIRFAHHEYIVMHRPHDQAWRQVHSCQARRQVGQTAAVDAMISDTADPPAGRLYRRRRSAPVLASACCHSTRSLHPDSSSDQSAPGLAHAVLSKPSAVLLQQTRDQSPLTPDGTTVRVLYLVDLGVSQKP